MKSIATPANERAERPYPKLMYYADEGDSVILLMFGKTRGVIVHSEGEDSRPIGDSSERWSTDNLVDYEGSVTLSND